MKVSYNWLQNYFEEKLPSPEKLAELLTFHVFEIESLEKTHGGKDTVLDVKVLPDRARYALSHKGIAYEIGAILNLPLKIYPLTIKASGKKEIEVVIEDSEACPRYMARKIEGITMAPTPEWLKQSLEVLGQRSINSVVDAANLTLLDLGQPLHVFDADKIKGNIIIRFAKAGEKITTLDGREIMLDPTILVIADDEGPLVIAGIKGGTRAEVTASTKNIIIESANFNASLIRKTSTKIGIRTDASKRYENSISPDVAPLAMEKVTALIQTINSPKLISDVTDIYLNPVKSFELSIPLEYINDRLGVSLDEKTISDILNRLELSHTISNGNFTITIPTWRGDLTIPEDIVEEVGRIYGYEKIPAKLLPETSFTPKVNKELYYADLVKDLLVENGFSEVYTYAFQPKGEITLEKPLASDKAYLRTSLVEGIQQSLELNAKNADLLGLDQIKIFEIGTLFKESGESVHLVAGLKYIKKSKKKESEELQEVFTVLSKELNIDISSVGTVADNLLKLNISKLLDLLQEPSAYEPIELNDPRSLKKYKPFSVYPFSVRDIAVFTPEGTEEKAVRDIIEKNAGDLLVRNTLFDVFTKSFKNDDPVKPEIKKTSYAFRLVLQSQEKTLTEDEINSIMKKITDEMNSREDWQVR